MAVAVPATGPNEDDTYGHTVWQRSNIVVDNGVTIKIGTSGGLLDKNGNNALATVFVSTQTGTSYTYALSDAGTWVRHSNGSGITATVPANSSVAFPIGTQITVEQSGAGLLTIAADGGVTVRTTTTLKLNAQYAVATLVKVGTDEWNLSGNLSAS